MTLQKCERSWTCFLISKKKDASVELNRMRVQSCSCPRWWSEVVEGSWTLRCLKNTHVWVFAFCILVPLISGSLKRQEQEPSLKLCSWLLIMCCLFPCLQLSECVRRGVSLLVRDPGGCSVLHIAAQKGHAELVAYILQQGRTTNECTPVGEMLTFRPWSDHHPQTPFQVGLTTQELGGSTWPQNLNMSTNRTCLKAHDPWRQTDDQTWVWQTWDFLLCPVSSAPKMSNQIGIWGIWRSDQGHKVPQKALCCGWLLSAANSS